MQVFMLGWEFPPYISGGLGTACHGLTRALSHADVSVLFVLPKATIHGAEESHVKLLGLHSRGEAADDTAQPVQSEVGEDYVLPGHTNVTFKTVKSKMLSPYQSAGGKLWPCCVGAQTGAEPDRPSSFLGRTMGLGPTTGRMGRTTGKLGDIDMYDGDLIANSHLYAQHCVQLASHEQFDVVHAHDWLTFPAGMAVAAAFGKPLVVHVHSTEFDRAGDKVHHKVYEIERRGMHAAMRVIAVSDMTGQIIQHRYGVENDKIEVIYNGIENDNGIGAEVRPQTGIGRSDKIVLFVGRITMQKGPEYFIMAAKKVLEKIDNVKFVMAGTGDKIRDVIELAAREGIGHRVLFTGFLRGDDVHRVYSMADVYVMPSVSEPFGIAPLEAINHDVPVIISKTSGVAEVLTHVLKVDFWDTDDIANKIIAVLKHPPLSRTLRKHADIEARRLTWDGAASKCRSVYDRVIAMMTAGVH